MTNQLFARDVPYGQTFTTGQRDVYDREIVYQRLDPRITAINLHPDDLAENGGSFIAARDHAAYLGPVDAAIRADAPVILYDKYAVVHAARRYSYVPRADEQYWYVRPATQPETLELELKIWIGGEQNIFGGSQIVMTNARLANVKAWLDANSITEVMLSAALAEEE